MPVEIQEITQAYKFALAPTGPQTHAFYSHAGAARYSYNWGLSQVAAALDARAAFQEANPAAAKKEGPKIPGHFDLCKSWTAFKNEHADDPEPEPGERRTNTSWVGENFVGTYQAALRDAATAWSNFFSSRSGKRAGRAMRRPRFKSRHRSRLSFQVHGDVLRVTDNHHVKLPKIGVVRTHESTRKLLRRLRDGRATIVRGTLSFDSSGRWFIALTVKVLREIRTGPSRRQREGGPIGIDFGVRDVATLSTGETIANPRYLEASLGKLAAAQRAYARTQKGSKGRDQARRRVARCHARVRNQRLDALHKTTSAIIHGHDKIAVEGWDVAQTLAHGSDKLPKKVRADRNRGLADTGIGIARWMLESKSRWYGATVVVTDRHEPTGRTCSACAQVKTKPVPPSDEQFSCPSCGIRLDRRLNSARVLAKVAVRGDAPSGGESKNGRGGGGRPEVPLVRQAALGEAASQPPDRIAEPGTGAPGP